MSKKIKTSLLNDLISSDFFSMGGRLYTLSSYSNSTFMFGRDSIVMLDPLQILKSIKQFVRLLMFLKKQDKKHIVFLVQNRQHSNIIKSFFDNEGCGFSYYVGETIPRKPLEEGTVCLCISLQSEFGEKFLSNKLFSNKIFLAVSVNSFLTKKSFGEYKIFNNFSDFKKLVLLLSLISLTLKEK